MNDHEPPWETRNRLKSAAPAAVPPQTPAPSSKAVTEARLKQSQMSVMQGIAAVIKDERALHDAERDRLQSEIAELRQLVKDLAQELRGDISQAGNYAPDAMYLNATSANLKAMKAGMNKYALAFMRERASIVEGKENIGVVLRGALT